MPHHLAFNLTIASDLPLWMEQVPNSPIDLRIILAQSDDTPPAAQHDSLNFASVARVVVTDGREIRLFPAPNATQAELVQLASGPALALALHQRGRVVLHASSMSVATQGVAALGISGAGKSTLAGSMWRRGHPVLSDGMTVLELHDGAAWVLRGPPVLRVWPDAATFLGADPETLPSVVPSMDKRIFRIEPGQSEARTKLARVFSLTDGPEVHCEALRPFDGAFELIKHHYLTPYLGAAGMEEITRRCAAIASMAQVYRLTRPRELEEIPRMMEVLEG